MRLHLLQVGRTEGRLWPLLHTADAPLFDTIDRRFEDILRNTDLAVERDEKASVGLDYRIIVLSKAIGSSR